MRAGKKMTTLRLRHPKSATPLHHDVHHAHPPKHKTMACVLKMAVKKSAS